VVGPGDLPLFGNFNTLVCPTSPKPRYGHKRQFPKLSNLGRDGPPENETAAPSGIGSGGKRFGHDDSDLYRRPRAASRWRKLSDITAAMLRRRLGGRR
jgi:hypothetical protein